jgi:hypothetical protein
MSGDAMASMETMVTNPGLVAQGQQDLATAQRSGNMLRFYN